MDSVQKFKLSFKHQATDDTAIILSYTVWLGILSRDFTPWNLDLRIAIFCNISLYFVQDTYVSTH
jgi:hypothetical protein